MKTFQKLFFLILISCLPLLFSLRQQDIDYSKLGKGRIVEKDKSIKKNIILQKIYLGTEDKAGYIMYLKDGSLHDMPIEEIDRIEFPGAEQGAVKMVFEENLLRIKKL